MSVADDVVVVADVDLRTPAELDDVWRRWPGAKVVVVCHRPAQDALRYLRWGVDAVIDEASAQDGLDAVLGAAHAGLRTLPAPQLATAVSEAEQGAHRRRRDELLARLSPREREVLELAIRGSRRADIATALAISPRTVATHLQHAFRRIGVCSCGEAGDVIGSAA